MDSMTDEPRLSFSSRMGHIEVHFEPNLPNPSWLGYPCVYVAGKSRIILTGQMPNDSRLDGKHLRLRGRLVEDNDFTMFFVEGYIICD